LSITCCRWYYTLFIYFSCFLLLFVLL